MIKISVLVSLYRCSDYIESFLKYALEIVNLDEVEFLLLHNDPLDEESEIINNYLSKFPDAKHVIIKDRESLYRTWNRGIKLSKGRYIAVWNVDDIRNPQSLQTQAISLDLNLEAAMSYGDFFETNKYGTQNGHLHLHPSWKDGKKEFLRRHLIGCFPMWRKSIHDDVGYFDENYRLVADYEFQLRIAVNHSLVKAEGNLGYYLGQLPHKLSSQRGLQKLERASVEYRYGMYDRTDLLEIKKAFESFDTYNVINFGEKVALHNLVKDYSGFLKSRSYLKIFSPGKTGLFLAKRVVKRLIGRN